MFDNDNIISDTFVKEIIDEESNFFGEETLKDENFFKLNQIAQKMEVWLKNVDSLKIKFTTKKQIAKEYQRQISIATQFPSMEKRFQYANKAKKLKEQYLKDNDEALILLKEGYYLVHQFRETFTGQIITYQILMRNSGSGMESDLSEVQLSLDEILSVADKVHKVSEDNFALYISQADMRRAELQKIGNVSALDDHQSQLFDAIQEIWTNPPRVRGEQPKLPKTINRGRVYEVYMKYRNNSDFLSFPLGQKESRRVLWSLAKAQGENIKGWLQGDYEDKQLKAVLDGSTANLMSMNSAKNIIQQTINILRNSKTDRTRIANLIKVYTTKGINRSALKYIDKDIRDSALKYIQENYTDKITIDI